MADAEQAAATALQDVSLDDKYDLSKERIFLSGTQAIIRMLLMQQRARPARRARTRPASSPAIAARRSAASTSSSGRRRSSSRPADIVFQPGLNEDLAATASGAPSRPRLRGEGKLRRRVRLWYGKGPGVDRSGDVFRHANLAGSSKHGGVLALMGDDHTAESSTIAHPVRIPLRRRDDADPQPGRRPGDHRLRPLRLCAVALRRHLGGDQMRQGQHRIDGLGRWLARPAEHRHPGRFRHAARRPQHPPRDDILGQEARLHDYKRDAARPSSAPTGSTGSSISGGREPEDRHHHRRQELSRRAPGARRPRHRRGRAPTTSAAALKVACPGRSTRHDWPTSRAASTSSSSSRRSAR